MVYKGRRCHGRVQGRSADHLRGLQSDQSRPCVHWSEDGQHLGSGPRVYEGGSPVSAMVAYKGGVLTAFAICGPPNPVPYCVHWSEDGQHLGSGPRVYAGYSAVTAMVAYKGGVLTAFADWGPCDDQPYCIHWSEDGQHLGSGPRAYAGSYFVGSILPLGGGILTAFEGLPWPTDPKSCPLPSYCAAVVLMCQKGRLEGNVCAPGSVEPCGVSSDLLP